MKGEFSFSCCVVVVEECKDNGAGVVEGREGKTAVIVVVGFRVASSTRLRSLSLKRVCKR